MNTCIRSKWTLIAAVVTTIALIAGPIMAAYSQQSRQDDRDQMQQDRYDTGQQDPYGRQPQRRFETQRQPYAEQWQNRQFRQYDQDWDAGRQQTRRYEQRDWRTGGRTAEGWQQQGMRIERQLQQQVRGAENITVVADQDEVYLYGRVQDESTKRRIGNAVQQLAGTGNVDNKLIVDEQGWERRNDSAIQSDIESELMWSPWVDKDAVRVSVNNGVATLRGTVRGAGEMAAAVGNAFEGGARSVRNQLRIEGRRQRTARRRQFETDRDYYPPYGYTPGQEERFEQRDPTEITAEPPQGGAGDGRRGR